MNIGAINQNKSFDLENHYKVHEIVKISKPAEMNNSFSEKEVKNAANKINEFLDDKGIHVKYEKHDVFNQMIIKVIDNNTNEVIKEIPSKKILDMVAKMCEMAGILVDKKA